MLSPDGASAAPGLEQVTQPVGVAGAEHDDDAQDNIGLTCDGAGGLVASAPGMGRYLAVYLDGTDDLTVQATPPLLQQGQWGRAYLWNTYRPDTEGMLYHGGGTFNTSSWVSIYPREGLGVFLVTPDATDDVQEALNESANAIVARLRQAHPPGPA